MNVYYLYYLILLNNYIFSLNIFNVFTIKTVDRLNINKITTPKVDIKPIHKDLKKLSLLSKLIYEYDYVNSINEKNNYILNSNINITTNLTLNFIQSTNIYFNLVQHITFLNKNNFTTKNTDKYFNILNKQFPDTQIYGYFYNKKRLHSLILINHKSKEIITVFRGSQYVEEWLNNLIIYEKKIFFADNFKIHKGIYDMYVNEDVDKNIVYILRNLFFYFPTYRKIITGHSKGAINSILLAYELSEKLNDKYNYEIFTFGSPPIFNYNFGHFLHNHNNFKIYNVMNAYDIVTSFTIPYRYHIGNEIQLNGINISIINHTAPYQINFLDTLIHFYISFIRHDMNKYIEYIFLNSISS